MADYVFILHMYIVQSVLVFAYAREIIIEVQLVSDDLLT